jgi:hypothetical protein
MKDFALFYQEAAVALLKLKSNCAKDFYLWRIFTSYDRGEFGFGQLDFERFNEYVETNGGSKYQRNTVDIALMELTEAGFIRRKQRGVYLLNPHLIWKGTLEKRKDAIEAWDKILASELA